MARIGPDGVVSWGDDSKRQGAASMEKEGEGKYTLRRFATYPSDAGVYRCAVSVYAGKLNPGPSAPATVTQRSEGVTVNVKTKGTKTEKGLTRMAAQGNSKRQWKLYNPIEFIC